MKRFVLTLAILLGWAVGAQAVTSNLQIIDFAKMEKHFGDAVAPMGLPWKVGENATYKMNMGGFINGTMVMKVREEIFEGFWVDQDVDLGFMGKQKIEMLVDKNNGQILQLIVNGQKQDPPAAEDSEMEDMRDDRITVPAGTFDCIYVKMKDTKNNQTSEAWVNPTLIPVAGMIKTLADSQLGKVTVELTAFEKK